MTIALRKPADSVRLDDAELIRAQYWQRKGRTLSEIAALLSTDSKRANYERRVTDRDVFFND